MLGISVPSLDGVADCRQNRVARSIDKVEEHEKLTLEVGSAIVLCALALGLQLGNWSIWSALPAIGGYVAWVIAYSEATVQLAKHQTAGVSTPRRATHQVR